MDGRAVTKAARRHWLASGLAPVTENAIAAPISVGATISLTGKPSATCR